MEAVADANRLKAQNSSADGSWEVPSAEYQEYSNACDRAGRYKDMIFYRLMKLLK